MTTPRDVAQRHGKNAHSRTPHSNHSSRRKHAARTKTPHDQQSIVVGSRVRVTPVTSHPAHRRRVVDPDGMQRYVSAGIPETTTSRVSFVNYDSYTRSDIATLADNRRFILSHTRRDGVEETNGAFTITLEQVID